MAHIKRRALFPFVAGVFAVLFGVTAISVGVVMMTDGFFPGVFSIGAGLMVLAFVWDESRGAL